MNHPESNHPEPRTIEPNSVEPGVPSEERTWSTILVLLGLIGLLGVPFGNILGPLVAWILKKEGSPFIDAVGKEVLNFQISYFIYAAIAGLTMFILIGFVLFPIVVVAWLVFTIIGAMKVNEGTFYRFPGSFRLIK